MLTHDDHAPHVPHVHHLRVGDRVTVRRDVLAELGRLSDGIPPTWFCVPAGTPGRLLGWRDGRALIDLDGTPQRVVAFVGDRHLARALRDAAPAARPRVNIRPTRPMARRALHRSRHRG